MKQSRTKKNWQKYMAVMLAATLVVTPAISGNTAEAAQKGSAKSIKLTAADNVNVIVVGKKYKLNYNVSPKTSKDKVTFTSSNSDVATVSKGIITPKKTGNVTITATTTSGKKSSVKFLSMNKSGVTGWQSRIDKMLAADNVTAISIKELDLERNYQIEKGDYSKKTLTVNAPNSDVDNYGTFKTIRIKDVKNGTWMENAKNNSITVDDDDIALVIDKNAEVKGLTFTAPNASVNLKSEGKLNQVTISGTDSKINLTANGTIGKIILDSKADIAILGNAEKVILEVTKKASGAKIESSVTLDAAVASNVNVKLLAGAEGSTVEKANADIKVELNNSTASKVEIGTAGSDKKESVDAGKDNTTTPGGGAGGGGSTGDSGNTTPSDTTKTVTGVSSNNGKTAVYTLPTAVDNLKSAVVKVTTNAITKDYSVDGTILTYVKKLLASEATYVKLWKGLNGFETSLGVGGSTIKIDGTSDPMTKKVTFDGMEFTVSVNETTGEITVKKSNGTATYTLSKAGRNTLTITSDTNTNVSDMVAFQVTY